MTDLKTIGDELWSLIEADGGELPDVIGESGVKMLAEYVAKKIAAPVEGWQLVPKEPTREMLDAMPPLPAVHLPVPDVEKGLMPSQVQNRTRYLAALAAAPKLTL
jgi:hypothetical protein